MRPFYITFCAILFLMSCNRHLAVREINTDNIPVDTSIGVIDSTLDSMVKPYRDSIRLSMSALVAVSSLPIVKGKPESKLTNLVTDILLDFGKKYSLEQKSGIVPVAAYTNYGGLRASLPQGEITVERMFELMPFENEIVLLKITGESFRLMAEKIAARGGEGVSGMKLGIKDGKVSHLTCNGQTIQPDSSYWLVTNDYIANGGDQMSMFLNPLDRINTKIKIRDELIRALSEQYRKNGIITVLEDGRIYNEQ